MNKGTPEDPGIAQELGRTTHSDMSASKTLAQLLNFGGSFL